jgi:hypothetical protein
MKYISTLLAALLVVASLAVLPIYADEGGGGDEYGEPPTMENEIVILADEGDGGGDMHGEPSQEEARDAILV